MCPAAQPVELPTLAYLEKLLADLPQIKTAVPEAAAVREKQQAARAWAARAAKELAAPVTYERLPALEALADAGAVLGVQIDELTALQQQIGLVQVRWLQGLHPLLQTGGFLCLCACIRAA